MTQPDAPRVMPADGGSAALDPVEGAVKAVARGESVVVLDDEDRERGS